MTREPGDPALDLKNRVESAAERLRLDGSGVSALAERIGEGRARQTLERYASGITDCRANLGGSTAQALALVEDIETRGNVIGFMLDTFDLIDAISAKLGLDPLTGDSLAGEIPPDGRLVSVIIKQLKERDPGVQGFSDAYDDLRPIAERLGVEP